MKFKVIDKITEKEAEGNFYIDQNGKLYQQIQSGYESNTMLIEANERYYIVEFTE